MLRRGRDEEARSSRATRLGLAPSPPTAPLPAPVSALPRVQLFSCRLCLLAVTTFPHPFTQRTPSDTPGPSFPTKALRCGPQGRPPLGRCPPRRSVGTRAAENTAWKGSLWAARAGQRDPQPPPVPPACLPPADAVSQLGLPGAVRPLRPHCAGLRLISFRRS